MASRRYSRLFDRISHAANVAETIINSITIILGNEDQGFTPFDLLEAGPSSFPDVVREANQLQLYICRGAFPAVDLYPQLDLLTTYLDGGYSNTVPPSAPAGQVEDFRNAVNARTSYEVETGGDTENDPLAALLLYATTNGLPAPS